MRPVICHAVTLSFSAAGAISGISTQSPTHHSARPKRAPPPRMALLNRAIIPNCHTPGLGDLQPATCSLQTWVSLGGSPIRQASPRRRPPAPAPAPAYQITYTLTRYYSSIVHSATRPASASPNTSLPLPPAQTRLFDFPRRGARLDHANPCMMTIGASRENVARVPRHMGDDDNAGTGLQILRRLPAYPPGLAPSVPYHTSTVAAVASMLIYHITLKKNEWTTCTVLCTRERPPRGKSLTLSLLQVPRWPTRPCMHACTYRGMYLSMYTTMYR